MKDGDGLTLGQRRFVDAMVTHASVSAACEAADVSVRSGYRWIRLPAVQAAIDAERRRMLDVVAAGVRGTLDQAFKAAGELVGCALPAHAATRASVALGLINAGVKIGTVYAREKAAPAGGDVLGLLAGLWDEMQDAS